LLFTYFFLVTRDYVMRSISRFFHLAKLVEGILIEPFSFYLNVDYSSDDGSDSY